MSVCMCTFTHILNENHTCIFYYSNDAVFNVYPDNKANYAITMPKMIVMLQHITHNEICF